MSENVSEAMRDMVEEGLTPAGFRRDPDVIAVFTIPEEMAQELNRLLAKNANKKDLLRTLIGTAEYDVLEEMLIIDQQKVSAIQVRITTEYVPEQYRNSKYTWEYPGYEITKNEVWIKKTV